MPASPPNRPPLSIDDLHRLHRVGALTLAPDGQAAVCTVSRGVMEENRSRTQLWLLPLARGQRPRALTQCGEHDAQPAWSPRGDRIAFLARRTQDGETDATTQLYLIAPDGGEARRASRFAPGISSFKWMPDGRRVVFAAWTWRGLKGAADQARRHRAWAARKESGYVTDEAFHRHWDHLIPMGRVLHLWLLDVETGRATDLFEDNALELPREAGGAIDFDPHPDGRRIAFVHDPMHPPRPANPTALAEIDVRSRRWRPLADTPGWDFGAPSWHPDGSALACTAAAVGQRHTALHQPALWRPEGGWQRLTPAGWDHDVAGPLHWAGDGRALLFTAEDRGRCPLWRCDPATGAVERLDAPGWVQGFDSRGGQIVVCRDSHRHPAQVWTIGTRPRRLEAFNDTLLAGRRLGDTREVTVTGALGDPVQVWLTFPVDFNPRRRHPLLHVIHGGPFSAAGDSFSLRWNPHVLASRGHVVVQVNFHGSSGFGFAFHDSIMGRQGQLELQDIEAASDWLLRQRWADPKRLDASGGSYGGFLVAWMNGHARPGLYRRYVCHAGVFDRVATFSADSYLQRPRDLGAFYWEKMDKVLAQSPHAAAGAMRTPTLIIHGAKDYRVPDTNALAYYNTLKARGVEARLLWFDDENHWVLKPQNARQWYGEFLDWIGADRRSVQQTRRGPP
jgi:dipeptidyl aminopeptidase/acylaminoacyl peptidase